MDRKAADSIGDGGYCICLECNSRIPHRNCIRCLEMNCPVCGAAIMVREGSPYHLYALRKEMAQDGRPDSSSRRPVRMGRDIRIPDAVSQGV